MVDVPDQVSAQKGQSRWFQLNGLWQNRDFLKMWMGETVSLFGTQITALALPLLAVTVLNATPAQMGILNAAQTVPFLALSLLAGVWVDRHARRPVLILTNLARAALMSLIPLLALFGGLRIEYLYLITLLIGGCTVFFELAYQAYLPRLVERQQLVEGNVKLTITSSMAEIGGPGLAGVLIQILSAPFAIVFDALSYLVAALTLAKIRRAEPDSPPTPVNRHFRQDIGDGFQDLFHNRYLIAFMGEAATYNTFWNMLNAVLILYAIRNLDLNAGSLGAILSIGSIGALVGAVLTAPAARRFGMGRTIVLASMLGAVSPLLIPLAGNFSGAIVPLLGFSFFWRGLGVTGCNVHVYALRQAITPDDKLGRTNAVYRLLTYGFIPLGALLGGFLGERVGLSATLWIGAVGVSLSWLWLFFSPVRAIREFSNI